ncbi:MAG: hypothetical protein U1E96_05095 [Azonexus sp.]
MSPKRTLLALAAGIGLANVVLAFLVEPYSCEGGLTLYFWVGVVSILVLVVLPFLLLRGLPGLRRLAWSGLLGGCGAAVWVVGLIVANVRVFCRLF